jgi:hypothetical protein
MHRYVKIGARQILNESISRRVVSRDDLLFLDLGVKIDIITPRVLRVYELIKYYNQRYLFPSNAMGNPK